MALIDLFIFSFVLFANAPKVIDVFKYDASREQLGDSSDSSSTSGISM
jgi:hypothetical protein